MMMEYCLSIDSRTMICHYINFMNVINTHTDIADYWDLPMMMEYCLSIDWWTNHFHQSTSRRAINTHTDIATSWDFPVMMEYCLSIDWCPNHFHQSTLRRWLIHIQMLQIIDISQWWWNTSCQLIEGQHSIQSIYSRTMKLQVFDYVQFCQRCEITNWVWNASLQTHS